MQIILEVTLTNRSKTLTGKDHQEVANQFFKDFGEAIHEVVKLKFYTAENPEEYTETGGNETCIETLKHLKQGIMPGSAI
jgi:hypothetical protein|tara:strand:- start:1184 stop:1423 length:240 start_codon:yes stop_codon:yes gene_type:complete